MCKLYRAVWICVIIGQGAQEGGRLYDLSNSILLGWAEETFGIGGKANFNDRGGDDCSSSCCSSDA